MSAQAHLGDSGTRVSIKTGIDAEELAGRRYPYQEDITLVDGIDLVASTPGKDLNWLEDVTLLIEDGVPAVFDRYSNSFLKIHFAIPPGREDEIARKVLIKHLQDGNSYGIRLKAIGTKETVYTNCSVLHSDSIGLVFEVHRTVSEGGTIENVVSQYLVPWVNITYVLVMEEVT